MNYWKLVKWDKEEIKVKPENVEFIQKKLDHGEGFIKTPTRSIAVKDIKDFAETSEPFIDQKLIEDVHHALGEPLYNPDGSIVIRWVKKTVTKRDYQKNYLPLASYRKLSESDNHVIVTWRQPVHLIVPELMSELTKEDELNLSKRA